MLSISNLTKSYGGRTLFDETGFVISRGERVGLTGRNGSGKTTLMKMVLGQSQPDYGAISMPSGYRLSHLEQHIHFTEATVLKEVCLALPHSEDGIDLSYKAESILMGLGFDDAMLAANPLSLSGGFQVRLNLAKALVNEPDLLLLDEPTNYLDIISIRWLKSFLNSWPHEFMLITHDREFMNSVTTHTVGINRGKFIKIEGSTDKLIDRIIMDEERHESQRVNDVRKRRDAERFINRFRAQATKAKAVQSRIKQLGRLDTKEKLPMEDTLDFHFNALPFIGKSMIETYNLGFGYDEGAPLFSGLNIRVQKGDRIAVVGKNGAGKTTLLSLLAQELQPTSGKISINSKTKLAYFGQTNVERLHPDKTVNEEIADANPALGHKAARNIAGGMMFEGDAALKKVRVLSGGEKSRVLLGRILASPANLLILDEPSNHLDVESVDSLLAAMDNFEGAVIIVTHSEMILRAVAERLVVFDEGKAFTFEGTYDDFLRRHGFSEEGPIITSNAPKLTKGLYSPKELKRLKAKLRGERSSALTPLMTAMQRCETDIHKLEDESERCEHELVDASQKGDAQRIRELSQTMHAAKSQIDVLFDELTELNEKHDKLVTDFDKRLEELE